jgi:SAM-dependent methyltransferase
MTMKCVVCRNGMTGPYLDHTWKRYGNVYRLIKCSSCGSAYTDPLPAKAVLAQLYQSEFSYRWYQDHYAAKLRDCRVRLVEYRPFLGERILDFGGGLGYFARAAEQAGYVSQTYDPFAGASLGYPQRSWDTVVALHVLEHSTDLEHTLGQIGAALVPGGRLILAVPNFASCGYKALGMSWVWAQPPLIHVFHFTAEGLRTLLSRHGFVDPGVSYHERWDANACSDVAHVERFRRMDAAWGRRPYSKFALYRRLVARRNAWARFRALSRACATPNPCVEEYSELQIVTTYRTRDRMDDLTPRATTPRTSSIRDSMDCVARHEKAREMRPATNSAL